MCALHTGVSQSILRTFNLRWEFSCRNRTDFTVHKACYVVRIFDYDFACAVAKISKFRHHFVGRLHVKTFAVFRIIVTHACHDNISVNRIVRLRIVGVCRCHDALSKLVRKRDNSFVDGAQIVFGLHTLAVQVKFFFKHKSVVDNRLDFQIVIAGSDAFLFFQTCLLGNMPGMRSLVVRNAFDHGKENLSVAARGAYNQPFAVRFNH